MTIFLQGVVIVRQPTARFTLHLRWANDLTIDDDVIADVLKYKSQAKAMTYLAKPDFATLEASHILGELMALVINLPNSFVHRLGDRL